MKKGQEAAKTVRNIAKIARFIGANPETHLMEISRNLKLHPYTVQRCLKKIGEFLVLRSVNQQLGEGLPNLPTYIRLKEGITPDGIIRYLKVRNKIKIT